LQPPLHILEQGIFLQYTNQQKSLIISDNKHQKISGVAGSGKTFILAKRAVNAHKRHGQNVLILTFNITLKQYIHDRISDVRENFNWKFFYIINYHEFMNRTFNNLGIDINKENLNNNYSDENIFDNYKNKINKYKSIFIDEVQDLKPEWIKIIKKYFLEENGEFVVFGDEKQNIYLRELDKEEKKPYTGIKGNWNKLEEPMRYKGDGEKILYLALIFQKVFLKSYEIDQNYFQKNNFGIGLNIFDYKPFASNKNNVMEIGKEILEKIKIEKLHPNDVAILCLNVSFLQELENFYKTNKIKTITTFEQVKHRDLEDSKKIRKSKKVGFNPNNGMMKIATIHSFKGYEIETLFLIIDDDYRDKHHEAIYTALTRSRFNLFIFNNIKNISYDNFFKKYMNSI
jgi:superfamily I DNA/RNA helicase